MNSAEKFNFKVSAVGSEDKKPVVLRQLTLDKVLDWIDNQSLDPQVKEALKKSASSYPHKALGNWRKNYQRHLSKAQNIVKNRDTGEKHEEESITRVFAAGFTSPGQDSGGRPDVHPDVQNSGECGGGPCGEYPTERHGGEGFEDTAGACGDSGHGD